MDVTLPPMAIKRGDKYAVLNIPDLDTLSLAQRAAIAVQVWDQIKTLMEANGENLLTDNIDGRVGEATNSAADTVYYTRAAVKRKPELLAALLRDDIKVIDARREAGFHIRSKLEEGRPSEAIHTNNYWTGDKFDKLMNPLLGYLKLWKKRNFEYRHINPAEAKRRLRRIDEVMLYLQEAREDLVRRSHVATLRAPSERKEKVR
jgi:hypothetical protein